MVRKRQLGRGGWRAGLVAVAVLGLVVAGLSGVVVWQNSYAMNEQRMTIRQDGHDLRAVLTTPRDGARRHPLVVMVHGDGPIDATHEDGYRPIWEAFARAGYASLSWDKPGVAGAPGNWLHQSMDDRAHEVAAAIVWARSRPDIDAEHIGLWGASQAGWVMPKVAKRTPVAFVMATSTAVNWLQQGRYNLLAELRQEHASAAEIEGRIARSDRTRELLRRGASFEGYVRTMGGGDGMTADRWGFVGRNYTADATDDLLALRGVPVVLFLGGHDINVDSADTETVYRKQLEAGGALTVRRYPDADHSMVDDELARSGFRLTLTAIFAPRSVFVSHYLDDQEDFLRDLRSWS
ncbi:MULTISPECIES: alpha/beta hydrolase family protein [Streptosporangium]|uniref:Dienelactone hydrolase n=1 Tax=Streptosporangium brasiliense TaxID=47480 RepID=A0ABT9RIC0_9ACTN|nr:alpha/beta hydrolase [Streptosporangium brasiliense]MDP9869034.1 dienelactone hydrolase [Streptosporangium brasiliense]